MRQTWHIRQAVRHIAAGGIVAYPTETLYGIGCDPFNGAAVLRLLAMKRRGIEQGLILVVSRFAQIEPLLHTLSPAVRRRVAHPAGRPVTWLLPCLSEVPVWLRGRHHSLAFRITTHPVAAALCDHWGGPLVSTSANVHGRRAATGPLAVRRIFRNQLDYLIHDAGAASNRASEIRNGITGAILRRG